MIPASLAPALVAAADIARQDRAPTSADEPPVLGTARGAGRATTAIRMGRIVMAPFADARRTGRGREMTRLTCRPPSPATPLPPECAP